MDFINGPTTTGISFNYPVPSQNVAFSDPDNVNSQQLCDKVCQELTNNITVLPAQLPPVGMAHDLSVSSVNAAPSPHRHHFLSRVLKGLLGTTKVMLGLATAIMTGGTVLGAVGGTLMILSGANDLICTITGKTLGEHIQDHWPDDIRAKRAGVTVDILLKLAGVCGGAIQGMTTTLEMIFHISLLTPFRILGGMSLSVMDELSKLIDGCGSNRRAEPGYTQLPANNDTATLYEECELHIEAINDYFHVSLKTHNEADTKLFSPSLSPCTLRV